MKTILKFILVILAVITSMGAHAVNGDFLVNVKKGNDKEISFSINGIQKANVTIYDKYHNVIYSEVATGKEGIAKIYRLDEFAEGVYFLEVETNLKKVTHEITVSNDTTTLSRKSISEVYKGDLKLKNDNLAAVN